MRGAITDLRRGYGFISHFGGARFFFHASDVIGAKFDDLRCGLAVEFDEVAGARGPRAVRVVVLG